MAGSSAFEWLCTALEEGTTLERLEARKHRVHRRCAPVNSARSKANLRDDALNGVGHLCLGRVVGALNGTRTSAFHWSVDDD